MSITASASMLPIERMRALGPELRQRFAAAQPFPHIVVDDLFDPGLLSTIVAEFPSPDAIEWQVYKNPREVKLASSRDEHFGPATKEFLFHLNSATFLDFLTEITAIPNLIADSYFNGGGMHQIPRGGKLSVHADFNVHPETKLDRRLNVLIYLNKNWDEAYGGALELWNRDMTAAAQKIMPVFNRMVLFATTDTAYHGHPDPLNCPPGTTRKSLALYYYSNGRPAEEISEARTTLFRARPNEDLGYRSSRVKELVKDLLPPVVTRLISRTIG